MRDKKKHIKTQQNKRYVNLPTNKYHSLEMITSSFIQFQTNNKHDKHDIELINTDIKLCNN